MQDQATAGPSAGSDLRAVLGAQQRRRRIRFWTGFAVILLVGGLWAGLTKDPVRPGFFDEGDVAEPAVAVIEEQVEFAPTTTAVVLPTETEPPSTTTAPASSTTGPATTELVTTEGP